jgi:hypothetical protein
MGDEIWYIFYNIFKLFEVQMVKKRLAHMVLIE